MGAPMGSPIAQHPLSIAGHTIPGVGLMGAPRG